VGDGRRAGPGVGAASPGSAVVALDLCEAALRLADDLEQLGDLRRAEVDLGEVRRDADAGIRSALGALSGHGVGAPLSLRVDPGECSEVLVLAAEPDVGSVDDRRL